MRPHSTCGSVHISRMPPAPPNRMARRDSAVDVDSFFVAAARVAAKKTQNVSALNFADTGRTQLSINRRSFWLYRLYH
jgi:hypothetical protein